MRNLRLVPDELLTVAQAAQRFDVSPSTLRRLWRAGDLEGAHERPGKFGREVAIPVDTLSALFADRDEAAGKADEIRRLLALLEGMHASHEREVADLRARLAEAERRLREATDPTSG
jgi:transposase-like protein